MNNYSEVTVDVDLLRAKTALVMSIAEDLKESVGGSFPMAVDKTMRSLQTRFLYFQSVFQEHGSVDALVKSASSIAMNGSKICNGLGRCCINRP